MFIHRQDFCALFPVQCQQALTSSTLGRVYSSHGFAFKLTLEQARAILDPFGVLRCCRVLAYAVQCPSGGALATSCLDVRERLMRSVLSAFR